MEMVGIVCNLWKMWDILDAVSIPSTCRVLSLIKWVIVNKITSCVVEYSRLRVGSMEWGLNERGGEIQFRC